MPIATHICLRLNIVKKNATTSETISHAVNPQFSSENPKNFYDSASIPTTEDMKTMPAITFGKYLRPQNATNGPLTIMINPKSHGYRYMNSVKLKSAASMHPALLSIMTLTSQADVSTPKTLVGPVLQASSVVKLYAFVPSHFDGDCCVKMNSSFRNSDLNGRVYHLSK